MTAVEPAGGEQAANVLQQDSSSRHATTPTPRSKLRSEHRRWWRDGRTWFTAMMPAMTAAPVWPEFSLAWCLCRELSTWAAVIVQASTSRANVTW